MWKPRKDSKKNDSNEDVSVEKKKSSLHSNLRGKKVKRFYHLKDGKQCHAWDIFLEHYENWKQGDVPCKAEWVVLPNGHQPEPFSRVYCGTCSATQFNLGEMETETVTL